MSNRLPAFLEALTQLDQAFIRIQTMGSSPELVTRGNERYWRVPRSITNALVLKIARQISLLRGTTRLLPYHMGQELGILWRAIEETNEDLLFLSLPLHNGGEMTARHNQFLDELFSEEFPDPAKPFAVKKPVARVAREKIRAAIARWEHQPLNTNNTQLVYAKMYNAMSGYTHGAATHIMDLYGGNPPKFHLDGIGELEIATRLWNHQANCFYQSLGVISIAAHAMNAVDASLALHKFTEVFSRDAGIAGLNEDPAKLLKPMK